MSAENPENPSEKNFGGMDMLLCAGITAACSVLGFEGIFPPKAMLPIRIAALILLAANWLFAAYKNGRYGRALFLLFSGLYWVFPTVVYIACEFSVKSGESETSLIQSICSLLTISPFAFASEISSLPEWFFGALTLIISAAVYKFSYSCFYVKENKNWL